MKMSTPRLFFNLAAINVIHREGKQNGVKNYNKKARLFSYLVDRENLSGPSLLNGYFLIPIRHSFFSLF